ncbi:MAG TPA: hypothetical protein VLK22_03385 [Candidatus Udaeobacter sp.]|nr:hypothetical protein [Candidatus Udaeobacter sp.]
MLIKSGKTTLTYKGNYGFWRLLKIIIIGILVYGAMFTCYFIYQNIYSTIANANAIVALKSKAGGYDLDLQAYQKARTAITQKNHLEEIPTNVRNIFYYITATSSTYANNNASPNTSTSSSKH